VEHTCATIELWFNHKANPRATAERLRDSVEFMLTCLERYPDVGDCGFRIVQQDTQQVGLPSAAELDRAAFEQRIAEVTSAPHE
jgi:hypothetical protein